MNNKKIQSKKGTTLVETLIAFLILVLALTMMAQLIVRAYAVIDKNRKEQENTQKAIENFWSGKYESEIDSGVNLHFAKDANQFNIPVTIKKYKCQGTNGKSKVIYQFEAKE